MKVLSGIIGSIVLPLTKEMKAGAIQNYGYARIKNLSGLLYIK